MAPKKSQPKLTKTQAAMAWLGDRRLAVTESYVGRGRPLATLTEAALAEHYIDNFRRFAADPHNDALRRVHADGEVEYRLRKTEPPHDAVAAERQALQDFLLNAFANDDGGPDGRDTARRVESEIRALAASMAANRKSAH